MLGYLFPNNVEDTAIEQLRIAEGKLIEFAKTFVHDDDDNQSSSSSSYEISINDTPISRNVLPLKNKNNNYWFSSSSKNDDNDLFIHDVCVKATTTTTSPTDGTTVKPPLVILHGYMNGSMYFYRNLVGLVTSSGGYFDTVHSLDMLGCGLSSRCPELLKYDVIDTSVESTEAVFVESLEEWRKAKNISKMVLAGHSMGGYISVAYAERYPNNVEQLILLSPAGVTHPDPERLQNFWNGMSWTGKTSASVAMTLFDYGITPASFIRNLPTKRGRSMIESYVERRLQSIVRDDERQAVVDYLYHNAIIPGSGEDMLNRLLTSTSYARIPTVDRIPKLQVSKVSFLYGDRDWMDVTGGIQVSDFCNEINNNNNNNRKGKRGIRRRNQKEEEEEDYDDTEEESLVRAPSVDVYQLQHAGHLLMLDNWKGFHTGIITMCGGRSGGSGSSSSSSGSTTTRNKSMFSSSSSPFLSSSSPSMISAVRIGQLL